MIALPSELLEPMIISALNLALTRLLEESIKAGDPSDEIMNRFMSRVEGINYVVVCNSCNNETLNDRNGVHASIAMSNFMRMAQRLCNEPINERREFIKGMRRI